MSNNKVHTPLFILLVFIFMAIGTVTNAVHAQQIYNEQTQQYETVQDDNDYNHRNDPQPEYGLEYNQYTQEYSIEREGAELEYNPYSGEYEFQK